MKSLALTLCLRDDPDKIEMYKQYHRQVWPEVLADLRAAGIHEMQIFLRGRRLFMYLVVDDDFDPVEGLRQAGTRSARSREWNELMASLQERAPEANPEEWWAPMELVFDLNWPQHRPG
ncbi:MAG: L-rhamnose mutarotase [Chloroflexi bacterium]|nr:L-rhamnose mutarotase [Chloroflexota bacterium]